MTQTNAVRLATIPSDDGKTSYWQLGEEVYRLNEYEPVQFNIYGIPLGARWETNMFHWPDLLKLLIPDIADHTNKACAEAQADRLDVAGSLYEVAKSADDAYQKALELQFGKNAGDARYDKRGESTLLLKDLKQAKQAADLAWHNAMRSNAYLAKR